MGYHVVSTDIADYGWSGCRTGVDYLTAAPIAGIEAMVTNPPYRLAVQFVRKAISGVGYVALLLRTNFLERVARKPLFQAHPPARIWVASRRLPIMHPYDWSGKKAGSNTAHSWLIWEAGAVEHCRVRWFDWKDYPDPQPSLLVEAAE